MGTETVLTPRLRQAAMINYADNHLKHHSHSPHDPNLLDRLIPLVPLLQTLDLF